MKKLLSTTIAVAAAVVLTPSVMAQSVNFSVDTVSGAGANQPDSAFGGAADQAGYWNSHVGTVNPNSPIDLMDLNGNATGASFTTSAQYFALSGTSNLVGATTDMTDLLAGYWDISGSAGLSDQQVFTFTGLENGVYNVYTYAMSPGSSGQFTRVNVNGDALDGAEGMQVVGGAFMGDFEEGITHSLHSGIEVTDGTLVINATSVNWGSIAGMQLQMVPAPGALALLGLAGLVGVRRRRN